MGVVEILSSGMYTSIQDSGRLGFSKYGVPKSGAMDLNSFFLANLILNNSKNCAVIEWTLIPPVLKFHADTIVSITGCVCTPFLNAKACKMNQQVQVVKGDVLRFKNVTNGMYGFVGIKNGFQSELVLGSRSQYENVTSTSVLRKGDHVSYVVSSGFSTNYAAIQVNTFWLEAHNIYVLQGPEFELLSDSQKDRLLSDSFVISNVRNRMAIGLEEQLENDLSSMMSSPVLPGTVQLTPSGKLMVLMRDCQTTGGYPRVLQLTKGAINKIAQKRVGEPIGFKLQSL